MQPSGDYDGNDTNRIHPAPLKSRGEKDCWLFNQANFVHINPLSLLICRKIIIKLSAAENSSENSLYYLSLFKVGSK